MQDNRLTGWGWGLLIGSVGLLVFGTIISEFEAHWLKLIGLFCEHLGIGLFAITILKITIEMNAERQWVSSLKTGITEQIKAVLAPLTYRITDILGEEPLKALEKSLFNLDFLRRDLHLTLELQPVSETADLVKCDLTLDYEVENVTNEPKAYTVVAWLDDIIKDTQVVANYTEIKVGSSHSSHALDISHLEREKAIISAGGVIQLKLEDNNIEPKKSLRVTVKGTQLMRKQDHFVWNLATVTRNMSFTIKLAGGFTFESSEIFPRPMHHMDEEEFKQSLIDRPPYEKTYKIDQVILPFQGVEVRWSL